jgi:large subunit ribosomal protein L1
MIMAKEPKKEVKKKVVKKVVAPVEVAPVLPVTEKIEETTNTDEVTTTPEESTVTKAKAGKRSAKAIKEVEELAAKTARKTSKADSEATDKSKKVIKPTKTRLERQGKKIRELSKLIDKTKTYELKDALDLAQKTSPTKFDASVDFHVRLNVDPKHADHNIRDIVVLPAGTGKTLKVAVFSDEKIPGADISGIEVITKLLEKQQLTFDVLIAEPASMAKLGKFARVLGPRGLMPNPKSGTVTANLTLAVADAKKGRIEYRVDSTGIVHVAIGKVSFTLDQLNENAEAFIASLRSNKPSSIKGAFIRSFFVTTSMGPSIAVKIV